MGFDLPKLLGGSGALLGLADLFETMVKQSVISQRTDIKIHQSHTLIIVGVKENHVVAITDEEPVVVGMIHNDLVDVVEHNVGYR